MKNQRRRIGVCHGISLIACFAVAVSGSFAAQLTVNSSVQYQLGSVRLNRQTQAIQVDTTGDNLVHRIETCTTNAATIAIPSDMTSVGYALFFNHSTSNLVRIGRAVASDPFMEVRAGEVALLRLATNVLQVVTTNGSAELEYIVFED